MSGEQAMAVERLIKPAHGIRADMDPHMAAMIAEIGDRYPRKIVTDAGGIGGQLGRYGFALTTPYKLRQERDIVLLGWYSTNQQPKWRPALTPNLEIELPVMAIHIGRTDDNDGQRDGKAPEWIEERIAAARLIMALALRFGPERIGLSAAAKRVMAIRSDIGIHHNHAVEFFYLQEVARPKLAPIAFSDGQHDQIIHQRLLKQAVVIDQTAHALAPNGHAPASNEPTDEDQGLARRRADPMLRDVEYQRGEPLSEEMLPSESGLTLTIDGMTSRYQSENISFAATKKTSRRSTISIKGLPQSISHALEQRHREATEAYLQNKGERLKLGEIVELPEMLQDHFAQSPIVDVTNSDSAGIGLRDTISIEAELPVSDDQGRPLGWRPYEPEWDVQRWRSY